MLCDQMLSKVVNPFSGLSKTGVCLNPSCPGKVLAGRPMN